MYIEPKVESSYRKNNLGLTIYNQVMELKPNIVINFGVLYGYSIIVIAQALKDIGRGKVIGYDIFKNYKYKNCSKETTQLNIDKYGVQNFVELRPENFYEWIENPTDFDLLHLDISNTGDVIQLVHDKLPKKNILFEGGSEERDQEWWMTEYNKSKMYPLKSKIDYDIIDSRWPSISFIKGEK